MSLWEKLRNKLAMKGLTIAKGDLYNIIPNPNPLPSSQNEFEISFK